MNAADTETTLDAEEAEAYARWFRCLADPTRIRILHVVAAAGRPVTVGEIVEQVDKSQSTVSTHLRALAAEEYVFTEADGVRTFVRVNPACMRGLPDAARRIMASDVPAPRRG